MGGCFHLPTEPPVAALPGSHLKKNWGWHILIEIDAHIWKKIPKKVNFAAITALLEIGRWYHPPIGMQTIKGYKVHMSMVTSEALLYLPFPMAWMA